MTAPRQPTKSGWRLAPRGTAPVLALGLVLAGSGIVVLPATRSAAGPVEIDRQTGLAISGFDPVAYFTEGKPVPGKVGLELNLGGVVWLFRNEGNRAAFVAHPEVYTPRFGGYDPVALARSTSVPGHPMIWVLLRERLYLFYDDKARAAFLADPGRILVAAERKWPAIARDLGQ